MLYASLGSAEQVSLLCALHHNFNHTPNMKRTLFLLSLSLVATAWAAEEATTPTITLDDELYAIRSGKMDGTDIVAGQHYIEFNKVSGSGDFYLSSNMAADGEALDLSTTNIWLSNDVDTPLYLKGVNIHNTLPVSSSNNTTDSHHGILVEKGKVVIDGVETGDLQSNLSIGTAIGDKRATLTISGGSKVETTAYYNTIGANGSTGILNVTGAETVLKTQQITLGSSTCLVGHHTNSSKHIIDGVEMCYDGIRMTVSEEKWNEVTADGASEGYGILNITDGATMHVGEGNSASTANNKLQIFNGEVNISGSDDKGQASTLYLHKGGYLSMDPNYGGGDAPNVKVALNIKDGGQLLTAEGEKIQYFTMGAGWDKNTVEARVSVEGEGSSMKLDSSGSWMIECAGKTVVEAVDGGAIELNTDYEAYIGTANRGNSTSREIIIKANSGGSIELNSQMDMALGSDEDSYGQYIFPGKITIEATGEDSKLALASKNGSLHVNELNRDDVYVTIKASDKATVSLSAGGNDITLSKNTLVDVQGEGTTLNTQGQVTANDAKITIGEDAEWKSEGDINLTGTTVLKNSGKLETQSITLGSGAVFDNNGTLSGTIEATEGAKITGSGSFGTMVVKTGSTLVVGNSPGLQTVEALEIQTGSETIFSVASLDVEDIASADNNGWGSGTYSSIEIGEGGDLTLEPGAKFIIAFGGDVFSESLLEPGEVGYTEQFDLLLIQGGVTLAPDDLSTLMQNTTFTASTEEGANPYNWTVSVNEAQYRVVDSNLYLSGKVTALVPEPTTATLSLLALCGLAARRRRK